MRTPGIMSTIIDPEKNITYKIMAYRELSKSEMVQAVQFYNQQKGSKKTKKGSTVTIHSIIGLGE